MIVKKLSKREQEAIKKVESFIRQLERNEIIIDQSAQTITLTNTVDGSQTTLAELLYRQIDNYRMMKNELGVRATFAELCLQGIQRAYTYGVVRETAGLLRKLEVLEDTNKQLRNEADTAKKKLAQLSAEYLNLQGRYEELDEKLNKAFKNKNGAGV